jgi:Predicted membrane protein (DUF2232)
MLQMVLVGIAAGAASAVLFASVASGALISILLFYLAPLPIMIAVLGWTHWAGLIAAIGASVALAAVFGGVFFFAFLIGVALPAWWLGYLAMLARPSDGKSPRVALEWYPPGRIVVWAAVLGAGSVIAAIPHFGLDEESFRVAVHTSFERIVRAQGGLPANVPLVIPGVSDPNRLIDILVLIIPATAAVLATVTHVINLWLAGRIVKFSGRLQRPWPDLASIEMPGLAGITLLVALGVSVLGGLVGIAATILAATLLMAFAVLGFAVLHAVTRGIDSRPFVLSGAYAAVMIFGWPVLVLSVIGLAEIAFHLRARMPKRRGPPAKT